MSALKLTISDVFFNWYNEELEEAEIINGIKEFFKIYPYFNEFLSIEELYEDFLNRV